MSAVTAPRGATLTREDLGLGLLVSNSNQMRTPISSDGRVCGRVGIIMGVLFTLPLELLIHVRHTGGISRYQS